MLSALPQEGEVSAQELEQLLAGHLAPVLADGHFEIGSTAMRISHAKYMYYAPGFYFDSAEEVDPALVKHTADDEGRLRLCLTVLATEEEAKELPASAVIAGETVALRWIRDAGASFDRAVAFSENFLSRDVPLLVSRRMLAENDAQQAQLDTMAVSGEKYADAPLLVFDVRNNGGGSDWYVDRFCEGYAGQMARQRCVTLAKDSPLNIRCFVWRGRSDAQRLTEAPAWEIHTSAGTWAEHQGLTLVLQDKYTASSGKDAVANFRTLENTLVIGSNTTGGYLTPNNFWFYLPHSGLGPLRPG